MEAATDRMVIWNIMKTSIDFFFWEDGLLVQPETYDGWKGGETTPRWWKGGETYDGWMAYEILFI